MPAGSRVQLEEKVSIAAETMRRAEQPRHHGPAHVKRHTAEHAASRHRRARAERRTGEVLSAVSMASAAALMLPVPAGMTASERQTAMGVRDIRSAAGASRGRGVQGKGR